MPLRIFFFGAAISAPGVRFVLDRISLIQCDLRFYLDFFLNFVRKF